MSKFSLKNIKVIIPHKITGKKNLKRTFLSQNLDSSEEINYIYFLIDKIRKMDSLKNFNEASDKNDPFSPKFFDDGLEIGPIKIKRTFFHETQTYNYHTQQLNGLKYNPTRVKFSYQEALEILKYIKTILGEIELKPFGGLIPSLAGNPLSCFTSQNVEKFFSEKIAFVTMSGAIRVRVYYASAGFYCFSVLRTKFSEEGKLTGPKLRLMIGDMKKLVEYLENDSKEIIKLMEEDIRKE